MPDVVDIITDVIKAKLEEIGLMVELDARLPNHLYFEIDGDACLIACGPYYAAIHDGQSEYGEYLYADPDFYARLIKRIRMLVKPTSVWHIWQADMLVGAPSILDE